MKYIPLHVYTGYSFLKSGLKIDQYLSEAKKLGLDYVGISDYSTFTSTPPFCHEAEKTGLKTIIGEDLLIDNLLFSFYVLSEEGYKNLLKLSLLVQQNKANSALISEYNEGLAIVLSITNDLLRESLAKDKNEFARKLAKLTKGFDNFYIGIDDSCNIAYVDAMREFAFTHGYKTIAFPTIKYIKKGDAIILEMMKAIETKEVLTEKVLNGNDYLKSNEEIEAFYTKEEIEATNNIANQVNFIFLKQRGKMISWLKETGRNADDVIKEEAYKGLKAKNLTDEKYINRINFELDTIKKMGYSDYFLIVQDYINYAKENNIAVGPGRGSASGSLVSHALGITVPDPFQYNLLFERFLNPARQTMPDIDVDFSDVYREEIVDYIRNKYGSNRVARIMAVQKIGAKQSLNDVGRIFNYEKHDIEMFTKLIKDEKDDKLSLREIYKTNESFRKLVNDDKYYLEIVTLASKIEGLPRQASLHAVGIVLNADPLEEVIPLSYAFDGGYVEQFEKDYIEEQGFLKMDILAIRNLTIVENCLTLLKEKGIHLNRDEIPYDDEKGIKLIASGKTMGLFQIESAGMKNAIKTLKIKNFEDVVALLALYRPGPMDSIKEYARKKNSNIKPKYISPVLEEILSPTYGTIVYQEQIMQIASKMAGFTLGEADSFRRAVSKKDKNKLESLRNSFVTGAIKNGYKEKEATDVFNLIDKFANYGFNRSHSVVYAIFTCRMAYLKAHYPHEFFASILSNASSSEFNNTISEMKALNIKAKCPDINKSVSYFKLIDNDIIFPLGSVKGISTVTVENILKERKESGLFKDVYDFAVRMKNYRFTDAQFMSLIDSGAFDSFGFNRATIRANLSKVLNYSMNAIPGLDEFQLEELQIKKQPFDIVEDNFLENLAREFNVLGLMVSGSPLDVYKEQIKTIKALSLDQIETSSGDIKVVAIIKKLKRITTKNNKEMAFVTVYDDKLEKEITLFSDAYEKSIEALHEGNIVVIDGYYKSLKEEFSVTGVHTLGDK